MSPTVPFGIHTDLSILEILNTLREGRQYFANVLINTVLNMEIMIYYEKTNVYTLEQFHKISCSKLTLHFNKE